MATADKRDWLRQAAAALRAGKFEPETVTEDWQRRALMRACPTDGSELHEAYPSKLEDQADESDDESGN